MTVSVIMGNRGFSSERDAAKPPILSSMEVIYGEYSAAVVVVPNSNWNLLTEGGGRTISGTSSEDHKEEKNRNPQSSGDFPHG